MSARWRDLLGSLLMLAFVGMLWVQRNYLTPFGGIFPDIVMMILTALVVLTIILTFTPWCAIKESRSSERKVSEKHWLSFFVLAVALLAWVSLLRYLGFALSGVIGFAGISWFLSEDRTSLRTIGISLCIAGALTFMLIVIFETLLQVPLPAGQIFG